MPVKYITLRAAVIRDDDPVMPRPAAVNCHIMMVHLKNNVLRCIVFDNGQIFPAEHDTSIKQLSVIISHSKADMGRNNESSVFGVFAIG